MTRILSNRDEEILMCVNDDELEALVFGRKIIGFQSIREDLLLAKASTEKLLEEDQNSILKASLWYSSLALYGRCFTDAAESQYPKLEPTQLAICHSSDFNSPCPCTPSLSSKCN